MLPTLYQQYIHLSRYSRWLEKEKRRETWEETVTRYCDFWREKYPELFPYEEIKEAIYNLEIMPSMRALMTAGKALDRDNVAGYNCSYLPIDNPKSFDELMYVLLCGTGVGFSVENQYISKLPEIPDELHKTGSTIVVGDSKIGWATAFRELLHLLYAGKIPNWDLSNVRPAGSRLKTFGGRASGPEPLEELFLFVVDIFSQARGRRLSTLECHDIICKIADVVVVGGVRRSALISLGDLSDQRLARSKVGNWYEHTPSRSLANNSAVYISKPDVGIFLDEWNNLIASKSGERGIFSRESAKATSNNGRRDPEHEFGTNPCGEIILRPYGFCNLSEAIIRSTDTLQEIYRKVRLATILGTFQSTLTNFRYLRNIWKKNAEEERLLGVSLTGIMDYALLNGTALDRDSMRTVLNTMKNIAIKTNEEVASKLGINASVAITTIKPSGTVSQLCDTSSGIHPRYSKYYLRTVRADKKDPLAKFMREHGFYVEDDVLKPEKTDVFYFPMKSPETSILRDNLSAIKQLELYLFYKEFWCEHNPSITVYVQENEWIDVAAWVYKHFDEIGGVAFLPHTEHIYRQAPYQEITKEEYEKWSEKLPKNVDWSRLLENEDGTIGTQELACTAGVCEL